MRPVNNRIIRDLHPAESMSVLGKNGADLMLAFTNGALLHLAHSS